MCESSMLGRLFLIGIRIRGIGKHVRQTSSLSNTFRTARGTHHF